ncbi:MAG: late competence development ComFB family protein [Thermoanaerobacteraceae bacterium]|nr:late competence development ComFB family protein [Thermoanaerobacteraceae bacterium]
MVYNYTEEAVRRILPDVLKEYTRNNPGVCTCARCQEDILALSLNQLPPHYVATDEGTIFTKVGFDQIGGKAQVVAAITNAIKRVAANPRHKNPISGSTE